MLGHVCFDAAIQLAARSLKDEWALCGGYALACVTRATAPHAKYQYVQQIFSPEEGRVTEDMWTKVMWGAAPEGHVVDKTFYWGDVDFFLRNSMLDEHLEAGGSGVPASRAGLHASAGPYDWEWTPRKTRKAMRNAHKSLTECLSSVAGYDNVWESLSEYARRSGYSGKLRNYNIGPGLLGRTQTIQFVMERSPKPDAFEIVLGFDMTQCAVWFEDTTLERGEPVLRLGMPCKKWKDAMMQRKGWMIIRNPRWPRAMSAEQKRKCRARRLKYLERGFTVKLTTLRRAMRMLVAHVTVRMQIPLT